MGGLSGARAEEKWPVKEVNMDYKRTQGNCQGEGNVSYFNCGSSFKGE